MFCKWELQEDCTNLWELMRRFDSEAELQSHELGRSMLQMVRDDDVGLHQLLPRTLSAPAPNPFDAIRTSLVAVDTAFQGMQPQVHVGLDVHFFVQAHRCYSCHWATQSACSHCGLCPITLNANFYSTATLLALNSQCFLPPRHVGIYNRFLCAPFLAPQNASSGLSFLAFIYAFFSATRK